VRALAQYNSFNFWGWLEGLPENKDLEIITGDIRDPHFCKKITKNIDIVFHLAALIAIPYSYIAPATYVETNIKGTLNICQASLENNVTHIIHTSTSEVYGTAQYVPIDEKHPKQPQSPYSASKIGADRLAESFYRSFDLPVSIVRPFNTFGPRQSARAIIPTIITQLLAGYSKIKLGDLTPTRDLLYVKDTVRGFVEIAKSENTIGEEINIATKSEISIGELADKIIKLINPKAEIVRDEARIRPAKSEVRRLYGDNSKIMRITNWNPAYSLEKALQETIKWYSDKDNLAHYKAGIYNI
jgi:NAD dependent epimerase/dehydratase